MLLSFGGGKERKCRKKEKDFQNFIRQMAKTESQEMIWKHCLKYSFPSVKQPVCSTPLQCWSSGWELLIYYFLYNKGSVQLTNGLYYQNAFVRWSCGTKCPFLENQCCKSLFGFKAGLHKPRESMMFLSYTTVLAWSLRSELGVTHFERKRLFFPFLGHKAIPGYGGHIYWTKNWGNGPT